MILVGGRSCSLRPRKMEERSFFFPQKKKGYCTRRRSLTAEVRFANFGGKRERNSLGKFSGFLV